MNTSPTQFGPPPGPARLRVAAALLSLGCLWFAGLALFRTRRVADIARVSPTAVRLLGLRDLLSAIALLGARNPRAAIVARVVCDGSDVLTFARRRPWLAGVAALYGALGVLALRAGSKHPRTGDR